MMTSSVIACVCSRSAKGSPAGHVATARSVASRMIVAVALDALAMEGGQHELALAQVLVAVEQQQRVRAERRAQDLVGLAGVGAPRARGEDVRTSSGSPSMTQAIGSMRAVKTSP